MPSFQNDPIIVRTTAPSGTENYNGGIYGESTLFNGVRGITYAPGHGAVVGISENHTSQAGPGVLGLSDGTGVWGTSKTWMGVYGNSESTTGGAGVMGESTTGEGVRGVSHGAHGGVVGINDWAGDGSPGSGGAGGWFESSQGEGVRGWSKNPNHGGVVGLNTGGGDAGYFDGNVGVTKTLTVGVDIVLANADCAEDFDISSVTKIEPGTVMVIDSGGTLKPSDQAYDKRVAGVISGAGSYKPGIVLDKQPSSKNRMPVALLGKVYCKVDAQHGAVKVGDLLTTSPTPGYAMKTDDPLKAFGAVVGKALRSLEQGKGLIPILVALQ